MRVGLIFLVAAVSAVTGCARETDEIGLARMPRITYHQYERYSCEAMDLELQRVAGNLRRVGARQDSAANRDDAAVAAAAALAIPFAATGGTSAAIVAGGGLVGADLITKKSDYVREVARLKGQYEALREAAGVKNCLAALGSPRNLAEPGGEVVMSLHRPGGPTPFEGVSLASFSSGEIDAWCSVPWRINRDPETGRSVYNPCRAPEYFR